MWRAFATSLQSAGAANTPVRAGGGDMAAGLIGSLAAWDDHRRSTLLRTAPLYDPAPYCFGRGDNDLS